MSHTENPLITISIPHWQSKEFIIPCLRSIRKHSTAYELEVIVIDNGSQDDSLAYLRSLSWIRLIERPEESPKNWPHNVFSAWDLGLTKASGQYYVTMHADVFIKRDNWLEPFLREMDSGANVVGTGSWKLEVKHPLYAFQKRYIGGTLKQLKRLIPGKNPKIDADAGKYPRDYCAMYDTQFLKEHAVGFSTKGHKISGGHQVATQIWAHGGEVRIFPVREMDKNLAHIAHGTTALTEDINLKRKTKQNQTIKKKVNLFNEKWILDLIEDSSSDQ